MQSTKQYMQQKIQPCIQQLFDHFLPHQNFKSIHDLFNAQKFHKFLMCMYFFIIQLFQSLPGEIKLKIQDTELIQQSEASNISYNQLKVKNFKKILDIIDSSFYFLGISMKRKLTYAQIENMVEKFNMKILNSFLEYIFELLKHNNDIVEFITTLSEDIQLNIMEIMKNAETGGPQFIQDSQQPKGSENSIHSLKMNSKIYKHGEHDTIYSHQQQLQQMQGSLILKQEQVKQLKLIKQQYQQELAQHRNILAKREEQIQMLKNRNIGYQQLDSLLQQKDAQCLKLTQKIRSIQQTYRSQKAELHNQIRSLQQKISYLQTKDLQLQSKYQKLKYQIDISNKQKQESDLALKKVITNLKQKNKTLTDKVNDLQRELIQVNFQKQLKQKQLNKIKSSMSLPNQSNKGYNHHYVDNLSSPRSPLKNDDFLEGIQSFRGNYSKLGQQLSVDLDRAQFQQDLAIISKPSDNASNKRFTQLLQQNYNLKQTVQTLQSSCSQESKQGKQLQDQVQKLKKKIVILKRRNDELDLQRKQQVELMIGVMQQCYSASFPLSIISGVNNKK